MINITLVFFSCWLLSSIIPMVESSSSCVDIWSLSSFICQLQLSILAALIYEIIHPTKTAEKTIAYVFFLYFALESQLYFLHAFLSYEVYLWGYFIFYVVLFCTFIKARFRQYNIKSDSLSHTNIYILFWKPTTPKTIFFSLLGLPVGGVSMFALGSWWGYKWQKKSFLTAVTRQDIIRKRFAVYDTGVDAMSDQGQQIIIKLNSLVGTPAGLFRVRCVKTIIPVLKLLGGKFVVKNCIELIPSIYSKRICEEK